jgi:GTP-binding protein HflX
MLVGIQSNDRQDRQAKESLSELNRLAETAGAEVVSQEKIGISRFDAGYCVPRSRLDHLAEKSREDEAQTVIFDNGLSPAQQRNLEDELKTKVLDRQQLILDIFAGRARSAEGKVQVELAQLKYLLPRLRGMWKHLERQAGGIGTRGPGEKQIESDRRRIQHRISRLEQQVKKLKKQRNTQRRSRMRNALPVIALVGYTNAGKSTLLNRLTEAEVLAEDKLFATLDPTARAAELPGGTRCVYTDTVGFIQNLPAQLAAAFRATLEEICYADLLLVVVDATSENIERDLKTTYEALDGLGIKSSKQVLTVWNKTDLLEDDIQRRALEFNEMPSYSVSAFTGAGIDELREGIEDALKTRAHEYTLLLHHDEYDLLARLHREARVDDIRYVDEGIEVDAALPGMLANELEDRRIA